MTSAISNLVSLLISQLPMLIVYAIGLITAHSYRQEYPQAASRFTWAIVLLLTDAILLSLASQWLLNRIVAQGAGESELWLTASVLGLARSLLHAWAFMLILHAVFPGTVGIRWPRRLLGAVLGLLIGGGLGLPLGETIGSVMGVSTFEGARGYFVVFVMVPLFAIVGAILGVIIAGVPKPAQ